LSRFATTSRDVTRPRPLGFRLRGAARRAILSGLSALPQTPLPGVRIVHYHYVFDDERAAFARQLAWLAREFEPVSLGEALRRLRSGLVGGRELVVTFDDGFRNQLVNAAPELAAHGFRACFFLVTGLLGAPPDEAERICRERLHLPRPVEPLSWDDAARLLELGHEVGAHTRSHPVLTGLREPELEEEMRGSREELAERLGNAPEHFSAPYGDRARFSPAVSAAARAAGYASCATAQRGRNVVSTDPFALLRDHLVASWPVRDLRTFLSRP
jgi:peptidoglycan/xylan/chitin deacetylase (PgdA/CDA1 family)